MKFKTSNWSIALCIVVFMIPLPIMGQSDYEKENIIIQMNYCINALTNITTNQSMTVLNAESDQILNNLKITDVRGEYELQTFRSDLFAAIRNLQITEEEKQVLRHVQDLKSKNMMWQSLSSALNPTMLLTGGKAGPQIAFQAILTAARTAVDYQSMKGEQEIEEIQAMWQIKKEQMQIIGELRSQALNLTFSLYDKYHFLGEWDRLTEETSTKFCNIINEPVASKRARLLLDDQEKYSMLPEYYYYLGMAYIGNDPNGKDANYAKAKPYLDKYISIYQRHPIFRYNQKVGIIALTKLAYDKQLTKEHKESLIKIALSNLPNNGSAMLQCALCYIAELNQPEKGFDLLRSGLDNEVSNKDEILSTITYYIDDIKKFPKIYQNICSSVNDSRSIGLTEYLPFIIATKGSTATQMINEMFEIKEGRWSNANICLKVDKHLEISGIKVYHLELDGTELEIQQQSLIPQFSLTEKEIKKKVDVFKVPGNENLIYMFVDPIILGERYMIKKNLEYNKIRTWQFSGHEQFTASEEEREEIIKFCEDKKSKNKHLVLNCKNSRKIIESEQNYSYLDMFYYPKYETVSKIRVGSSLKESKYQYKMEYNGIDTLSFIPSFFANQEGEYIAIDFGDISRTIALYKKDNDTWSLFSVERNNIISYTTPQSTTNLTAPGIWDRIKNTTGEVVDSTIVVIDRTGGEVVGTGKDLIEKGKETYNQGKEWIKGIVNQPIKK